MPSRQFQDQDGIFEEITYLRRSLQNALNILVHILLNTDQETLPGDLFSLVGELTSKVSRSQAYGGLGLLIIDLVLSSVMINIIMVTVLGCASPKLSVCDRVMQRYLFSCSRNAGICPSAKPLPCFL